MRSQRFLGVTAASTGAVLCLMLAGCSGGGTKCSDYLNLDEAGKVNAIIAAEPDVYKAYGDDAEVFARTSIPGFDDFCSDPENADWKIEDTTIGFR